MERTGVYDDESFVINNPFRQYASLKYDFATIRETRGQHSTAFSTVSRWRTFGNRRYYTAELYPICRFSPTDVPARRPRPESSSGQNVKIARNSIVSSENEYLTNLTNSLAGRFPGLLYITTLYTSSLA